jgi:hypothetical protein
MPDDLDNHASERRPRVSLMGDGIERAAWPAWSDLTNEQRYILYQTGTSEQNLICLLNGWVGGEDAPYWNRKGPYVAPLARAAQSLVEWGLVEVWAEPVTVGEGGLMLRDDAVAVLGDPSNWWRYDPDDNWDSNEDLSRYAGLEDSDTSPMTVIYSLFTTDATNELGLIRWPWWHGSRRRWRRRMC